MRSRGFVFASVLLLAGTLSCSRAENGLFSSAHSKLHGPLIRSSTTMVTAWDFPRNPLVDPTLDDSRLAKDIRWGFQIFTNTPGEAPRFTPSKVSCNNCHLNGGQREKSLPLVGVAGMFPGYNRGSGRPAGFDSAQGVVQQLSLERRAARKVVAACRRRRYVPGIQPALRPPLQ